MKEQQLKHLIKNIVRQIFFISATVVFVLVMFFGTITFSPIYILRFCVSKSKSFGPKLGKIITTLGTCVAVDDIHTNPKCTILVSNVIKGEFPDISLLQDLILTKIVNIRGDNGQLKYEEVQQYPYQWMGFLFWKWEESFDISQHVKLYSSPEINENSKVSEDELKKIENYLLLKAFEPNRSPWEILVVRNVESNDGNPQSAIFLRIHHCLADGFSIMKTVFTVFVDNSSSSLDTFMNKSNIVEKSLLEKTIYFIKVVSLAPYQFTKCLCESFESKVWLSRFLPQKQNKDIQKLVTGYSKKILLSDLKEIAHRHEVCLTAVIYAGLAAAIAKEIRKKTGDVPKYKYIFAIVPKPGHPDKLRNHFSFIFLRLPVGEFDPVKRLQKLQKEILELKDSLLPVISSCIWPLFGGLFPFMTKFLFSLPWTTIMSSSFPGPKEKIYTFGQEFLQCHFLTGQLPLNFAVNYHTITYCDSFQFTITSMIKSQSEVEEMVMDINEEFSIFKSGLYA